MAFENRGLPGVGRAHTDFMSAGAKGKLGGTNYTEWRWVRLRGGLCNNMVIVILDTNNICSQSRRCTQLVAVTGDTLSPTTASVFFPVFATFVVANISASQFTLILLL
jgi:hypothetical protein